jgi:hypothetical protein
MMPQALRFVSGPRSPLEGVSQEAWQRFVASLEVQAIGAVSNSGGLGSYDIRPRRLVELGYATALRSKRTPTSRQIQVCEFILPWTQARFLSDSIAQYVALSRSISMYYQALVKGEIEKPRDMSVAGALAVLHVGGRGALKSWPKLFEKTQVRYQAAQKAF